MRLLIAAYDGDMESVRCVLESGISVDVARPVRQQVVKFWKCHILMLSCFNTLF